MAIDIYFFLNNKIQFLSITANLNYFRQIVFSVFKCLLSIILISLQFIPQGIKKNLKNNMKASSYITIIIILAVVILATVLSIAWTWNSMEKTKAWEKFKVKRALYLTI